MQGNSCYEKSWQSGNSTLPLLFEEKSKMNRNVKIAKELVRLAKSLVSSTYGDFLKSQSDVLKILKNGFRTYYTDKLNDITNVNVDFDYEHDTMHIFLHAKPHFQDIPKALMHFAKLSLAGADFYEDEVEDVDDLVNQHNESAVGNKKSFDDLVQEGTSRVIMIEIYYGDLKNKMEIKKIDETYYFDDMKATGKQRNVSSSISSGDYSEEKFGNWIKNSVEQSGISLV